MEFMRSIERSRCTFTLLVATLFTTMPSLSALATNTPSLAIDVCDVPLIVAEGGSVTASGNPPCPGSGIKAEDSRFVSQSVPTTMVVGQPYQVRVDMQNTGSNLWIGKYQLMSDNKVWGTNIVPTPGTTAQDQTASFRFGVRAPLAAGSHYFGWAMTSDAITNFGQHSPGTFINVLPSVIKGNIEGINGGNIVGWACSTRLDAPIPLHLYVGGAAGTGVMVGSYPAHYASEAAVATACLANGSTYRFSIPITTAMVTAHGGKSIYLHGMSPVGAGNLTLANSGAFSLPVNKLPAISLTSPVPNAVVNAPGAFTLNATVNDPDDGVASVAFYNGSTLLATDTAAPFTHAVSNLAAGTYSFKAIAKDTRGASTTSATISTRVNAYPSISLTAPATNSTGVAPATFTLKATATDSDGPIANVVFYQSYNGTVSAVNTDTTAPYEYTLSGMQAGEHLVHAVVKDNWGATRTSNTARIVVAANKVPTVSMVAPLDGATVPLPPGSVTLKANATDSDGSIASVAFYSGTTLLNTDTSAPYEYTVGNLSAGSHTFKAIATDNGAFTHTSASVSINVVNNAGPEVAIVSPTDGATHQAPATLLLKAVASDSDGSIAGVDFFQGSTKLGTDVSAPYEFTVSNVLVGVHTFKAVARDNLGISKTSATITANVVSGDGAAQPARITRRYTYDAHQRLCRADEPETGSTFMGYDGANNLAWSAAGVATAAGGCQASSTAEVAARRVDRAYDLRNRLLAMDFPDGRGNQTWTYTADGLPSSITTNNSNGGEIVVNTYAYNKRRMLTGETVQQPDWYNWSIGYGYDAQGSLATQTYPTGLTISYTPNGLGQPTQVSDQHGTVYASGISYYPNGAARQFTYGNGIVHAMALNPRQLPDRVTDGSALDFTYRYDKSGNVTQIYDHIPDLTPGSPPKYRLMQYDKLDRLTGAGSAMFGSKGGGHWHYFTYDRLDNMTSWLRSDAKDYAQYLYDGNNRLSNILSSTGATLVGLDYDAQGNLANKNGQQYSFDYGNRLRVAQDKESYRYDGYGRRVLALHPTQGNILSQYSQAGHILYQSDFRKDVNSENIYLNGSVLAIRERLQSNGALTVKYQHTDALGSPAAVTNAAGAVIERNDYEPYGGVIGKPSYGGIGYTGHVQDAATGLTYMQQRYYDPELGRFLSVDPVTAYDSKDWRFFTRYSYAFNNPYKFIDPDGRQSWGITGTSDVGPAVREACDGDISCQKQTYGSLAKAQGAMALMLAPDPTDIAIVAVAGRVALGSKAGHGFSQAKRYIESAADNMRATGGRSGRRTTEFDGRGGQEGASKVFDKLTSGKSVPRDGGRLGSLRDGSKVQMSTRTLKDGGRETSVRISTERTGSHIRENIKIRFKD